MNLRKALIPALGALFCAHFAPPQESLAASNARLCTSTREYVTTLEYLRKTKEFALTEEQARQIAEDVSMGCTGAAKRFVQVMEILVKSRLSSKDALPLAKEFARAEDSKAETFITLFKVGFLSEHLDLDLSASLNLAKDLVVEYTGDLGLLSKDFQKLVDYCTNEKELNLPKPQCAQYTLKVIKHGSLFSKGIYDTYVKTMEFLRSKNGPGLSTMDAIPLTEEILSSGPIAHANFVSGFRYASSPRGLQLPASQSVEFARKMAKRSYQKTEEDPPAKIGKKKK